MAPSPPPAPLTALDARVQRAVEWMNDDERRVVWLRHSEDLPWATIAERLGTPPERVGAVLLDATYHVDEVVQGSDPPPERTRQCRPARQAFFARFDGQPVDPAAYAAAREHAAGCPNCTRARIVLRRAQIAFGAWTPVPFAEPAPAPAAATAAAPAVPAAPPAVRRRPPARPSTGTGAGRSRRPVAVAATLAAGAGAVVLTAGALGGDSAPSRAAEAVSTATPTPTPTLVPAKRTERREKKREEKADEPRRKPRKRAAAKPAATAEPTPTATPTPTPTPRSTPQPERRENQRKQQPERTPQPTATPRPVNTPAPTRTATPKPEPIPGDPNGDVIPPP